MSNDSTTPAPAKTTKPTLSEFIRSEIDKNPPTQTRLSRGTVGTPTEEQRSMFKTAVERFGAPGKDLMNFFGMEPNMSSSDERKLREMGVFLVAKGITGGGDMFMELARLESKFGPPRQGESRLERTHRFLSLLSDNEQIRKKIKAMIT